MKRKYKYEEYTIPEPFIHNHILKKQKSILDINDNFSLGESAIKYTSTNIVHNLKLLDNSSNIVDNLKLLDLLKLNIDDNKSKKK